MDLDTRMLIYGFGREVCAEDVLALLGPGYAAVVEMVLVPGDNDEAIAVVHLAAYRQLVTRLAGSLKARRYRGRLLQPWVPTMAWS